MVKKFEVTWSTCPKPKRFVPLDEAELGVAERGGDAEGAEAALTLGDSHDVGGAFAGTGRRRWCRWAAARRRHGGLGEVHHPRGRVAHLTGTGR